MKNLIYSALIVLTASFGYSQNNSQNNETINNGRIIGSFELGSQEVTTILDESTDCVRKTSPHTKGLFAPNENVEIILRENKQSAEVRKPSLPEKVWANKKCEDNTTMTIDEVRFIIRLGNALDSIIDNNVVDGIDRVNNPFNQFGIDHTEITIDIYQENQEKNFTIAWFFNEYDKKMEQLGYDTKSMRLHNLIGLIHKNKNQDSFENLRDDVFETTNSSYFVQQIVQLLFSKFEKVNSIENTQALIFEAERMIFETSTISNKVKDDFLMASAVVTNLDFIEFAMGPGPSWKDCAKFAVAGVGSFLGGPLTMVLGVATMAIYAEDCEKYLGW